MDNVNVTITITLHNLMLVLRALFSYLRGEVPATQEAAEAVNSVALELTRVSGNVEAVGAHIVSMGHVSDALRGLAQPIREDSRSCSVETAKVLEAAQRLHNEAELRDMQLEEAERQAREEAARRLYVELHIPGMIEGREILVDGDGNGLPLATELERWLESTVVLSVQLEGFGRIWFDPTAEKTPDNLSETAAHRLSDFEDRVYGRVIILPEGGLR